MLWVIALFFGTTHAGIFSDSALSSFVYQPCISPFPHPGLMDLIDFTVRPTKHGNWKASGKVALRVNVTAPVKAEVSMTNRVLGMNVPMVCVDNFGSCTYPDLCDLGTPLGQRCPRVLEKRDYPCRCPFEEGFYKIPGLIFPISSEIAKTRLFGTHHGRITIIAGGRIIACYEFTIRME